MGPGLDMQAQGLVGFHAVDVNHTVAIQCRQVAGFTQLPHQCLQNEPTALQHHLVTQQRQPQAAGARTEQVGLVVHFA
ncbi:hypothetical protein D3C80_1592380 [compost metagenome]